MNVANTVRVAVHFFLVMVVMLLVPIVVKAQRPTVNSVDKLKGAVSEVITITGDNFGTDATKVVVFFGAVKGTVQTISNQLLEVRLPAGSTYDNVSVTNLTSGLTGYSINPVYLTYGGKNPFDVNNLIGQTNFDASSGLYDLCMCDFDGDSKNDIATASSKVNTIKFFPNTSTGSGAISFNIGYPAIPIGGKTLHARCGDLNGDGKPDFVLSEVDGNRVFVFHNTSTGPGNFAFSLKAVVVSPGLKAKQLEIADLDLDGKPEVLVTDQGSPYIYVLKNISDPAVIKFDPTAVKIYIKQAAAINAIAVNDLNGDGLPEIVVSQFFVNDIYVLGNSSTPGTFNFALVQTFLTTAFANSLKIGDVDGDAKPDVIASFFSGDQVSVFLNTSTSTVTFNPFSTNIPVGKRPEGVDLGDLDGDGKLDVVVTSSFLKELTVLNNTSTPGNVSFTKASIPVTWITRHVAMGDLDLDGKVDIAFTSVDDDYTDPLDPSLKPSKVSVFRNRNCLKPKIDPIGPLSVCAGSPLKLTGNASQGVTYEWKNTTTNTVVKTGPDAFYDVIATGKYTVTAKAEGGFCAEVSNVVDVTVGGAALPSATATANTPLCVGSTLNLKVTSVGATAYQWTGPNGYTATGLAPTVPNFQLANVGRYYVEVINGTCVAQKTSVVVEAIALGNFTVLPASATVCQGDTKTLLASNVIAGATYDWYDQKAPTTKIKSNSSSYGATVSGTYFYTVTYPGCGTSTSGNSTIIVASLPTASYTAPATACTGQLITFNNTSSKDAVAAPQYLWTFGDGNTSTEESPKHSFTAAGSPSVTLRVSYTGDVCPSTTAPQGITVTAAPIPVITNPDNIYVVCPGGELLLEVTGSYNSFVWSTGETSPSILAKAGGTYSVEVTTNVCTLNATKDVTEYTTQKIIATATPPEVVQGETTQLNASGASDYAWTPATFISDPAIANPTAQPKNTIEYTVSGKDNNSCVVTGTVVVTVIGESAITKLKPKNFFSPNGDAISPYWVVENILEYPQCNVAIYDEKGVKIYEAKPYLNDWDGVNMGGKRMPDGVYYYIIRCDGEDTNPKAGSITLLR